MKTTIIGIALVASVSFCAFGGERVFLKCDETNPLRFEFSNVKYREFPMPGLKEAFAAIPPEDRPREFYIKCRAARLDGSVSWKVYANGNVSKFRDSHCRRPILQEFVRYAASGRVWAGR